MSSKNSLWACSLFNSTGRSFAILTVDDLPGIAQYRLSDHVQPLPGLFVTCLKAQFTGFSHGDAGQQGYQHQDDGEFDQREAAFGIVDA